MSDEQPVYDHYDGEPIDHNLTTICLQCGHVVHLGEGYCFGCDTLNPAVELAPTPTITQ